MSEHFDRVALDFRRRITYLHSPSMNPVLYKELGAINAVLYAISQLYAHFPSDQYSEISFIEVQRQRHVPETDIVALERAINSWAMTASCVISGQVAEIYDRHSTERVRSLFHVITQLLDNGIVLRNMLTPSIGLADRMVSISVVNTDEGFGVTVYVKAEA